MPEKVKKYRDQLEGRCLLVRKLRVLPIEAIVRGYITGSGWKEYQKKGSICDIKLKPGLQESEKLDEPLFTPSTKAELGDHGMIWQMLRILYHDDCRVLNIFH